MARLGDGALAVAVLEGDLPEVTINPTIEPVAQPFLSASKSPNTMLTYFYYYFTKATQNPSTAIVSVNVSDYWKENI